jgi:hypothetical protein
MKVLKMLYVHAWLAAFQLMRLAIWAYPKLVG